MQNLPSQRNVKQCKKGRITIQPPLPKISNLNKEEFKIIQITNLWEGWLDRNSTFYERRVPDGCKYTYFNQTFTIHALIIFDVGRYFCEAEKIQTKRELYLNVIPGNFVVRCIVFLA